MQLQSSRAGRDTTPDGTRLVPAPYVVAAVHGTDTALLDMRSERYYTLDSVGSRVWALLAEGHSPDDIASKIGEEFDAPSEKIVSDLRALLQHLEKASLITPTIGAGVP